MSDKRNKAIRYNSAEATKFVASAEAKYPRFGPALLGTPFENVLGVAP